MHLDILFLPCEFPARARPEQVAAVIDVIRSGMAGTRVNGEKITEHLLKHGDEIEVGKQKLLFRLER